MNRNIAFHALHAPRQTNQVFKYQVNENLDRVGCSKYAHNIRWKFQTKEKAESATRFDRTWRENIIITRHVHLCASFDASSTINRKKLLDFALLTF